MSKKNKLKLKKQLHKRKEDLKILISNKIILLQDLVDPIKRDELTKEISKLVKKWANLDIKLKEIETNRKIKV